MREDSRDLMPEPEATKGKCFIRNLTRYLMVKGKDLVTREIWKAETVKIRKSHMRLRRPQVSLWIPG